MRFFFFDFGFSFLFFLFTLQGNIWQQILSFHFILELVTTVPFAFTVSVGRFFHLSIMCEFYVFNSRKPIVSYSLQMCSLCGRNECTFLDIEKSKRPLNSLTKLWETIFKDFQGSKIRLRESVNSTGNTKLMAYLYFALESPFLI